MATAAADVGQACSHDDDCTTHICIGNICQDWGCHDTDWDGVCYRQDNCNGIYNASQTDMDGDHLGDACDWCYGPGNDTNWNGICDRVEFSQNATGSCRDGFTSGDETDVDCGGKVCGPCPVGDTCYVNADCASALCVNFRCFPVVCNDPDGDGFCTGLDNCTDRWNPSQLDIDSDGLGDACDNCYGPGADRQPFDGVCDEASFTPGFEDAPPGCDPLGELVDQDNDRLCDELDNCVDRWNPNQADADGDGHGDACDGCEGPGVDRDADGICDHLEDDPNVQPPPPVGEWVADLADETAADSTVTPFPPPVAAVLNVPTTPSAATVVAQSVPGAGAAPVLAPVTYTAKESSVVLHLPAVSGARDYRVFPLVAGVSASVDGAGRTDVLGATVTCAGFQQRNAPALAQPELVQAVEVNGLTGATVLVVEAIDRACPFAGVLGSAHHDEQVTSDEVPPEDRVRFSVRTEADIRAQYGSLILNGQGPAGVGGGLLAQAAPRNPPVVLARTVIQVAPDAVAAATARTRTVFDGFGPGSVQPQQLRPANPGRRAFKGFLHQSPNFSFYNYGASLGQFFVHDGMLRTVLIDWGQDVFGHNMIMPRQPLRVAHDSYLHVTFEVNVSPTQRRYWVVAMCGSDTPGETMTTEGKLLQPIVHSPFFYQDDGLNPSVAGWNCLQVFARDGWPFAIGGPTAPESDIRVMVNRAGAPRRGSVVNVSPPQGQGALARPAWFKRRDSGGNMTSESMLDDKMRAAPRVRFDLMIRRDRVILFADGEQLLCNDFPGEALTMAEGAFEIGHVLYHSTAERVAMERPDWDRRGQHHIQHNVPYVDVRTWDNIGVAEGVTAPAQFDAGACYVHPG